MLENYINSFKLYHQQMDANKTPMPPALGLELAKKALEPLKSNVKLQAIMAEFEARPEERQDLNSLLERLDKVAVDLREEKGGKDKLANNACEGK